MVTYCLSHLSDAALLRDLAALVARDRATNAALLAHLAEVDARKLYLPAAYPSMFAYCVGELGLSEELAYKRIRAARAARRFPDLYAAVADGRLHLSTVVLLASFLTPENAAELLAACAHRSRAEVEALIAQRFPRTELPVRAPGLEAGPGGESLLRTLPIVGGVGDDLSAPQLSPGTVGLQDDLSAPQLSPGTVGLQEDLSAPQLSPGTVERSRNGSAMQASPGRSMLAMVGPDRYELRISIGRQAHDLLRYAQALLSHRVPSGDLALVLERILQIAVPQIEKHRFAATGRSRRSRRLPQRGGRYIPAEIKRTVWERDGGQCTFISAAGRRCPARWLLEFDHVDPVARGGRATVDGLRLLCRAHNQFAAERTFGSGFMSRKRLQARAAAAERAKAAAVRKSKVEEVLPWLRRLGCRTEEARRAAEACENLLDAPLEDRVRAALSHLGPRGPAIRPTPA